MLTLCTGVVSHVQPGVHRTHGVKTGTQLPYVSTDGKSTLSFIPKETLLRDLFPSRGRAWN